MTLDDLILALTIHRDNQGGTTPVTIGTSTGEQSIVSVRVGSAEATLGGYIPTIRLDALPGHKSPPPNHIGIPAREADDLRKLAYAYPKFRAAVIAWSQSRYLPTPTEEYRRMKSEMVSAARDIIATMGHIDGDCER